MTTSISNRAMSFRRLLRRFHEAPARMATSPSGGLFGISAAHSEHSFTSTTLPTASLFFMEHYEGESHINVGTGNGRLHPRASPSLIQSVVAPPANDAEVRRHETGRHSSEASQRLQTEGTRLALLHPA